MERLSGILMDIQDNNPNPEEEFIDFVIDKTVYIMSKPFAGDPKKYLKQLISSRLKDLKHQWQVEARMLEARYFIDEVWNSENPDEIYPKLESHVKSISAELKKLTNPDTKEENK